MLILGNSCVPGILCLLSPVDVLLAVLFPELIKGVTQIPAAKLASFILISTFEEVTPFSSLLWQETCGGSYGHEANCDDCAHVN